MYSNQHILILGMGASGIAAAELARHHNAKVSLIDNNASEEQQIQAERLRQKGIFVYLNFTGEEWLDTPNLIIISPGLNPASSMGKLADAQHCPVISELEFGYLHCKCPILAITGTNGKTTTTEITTHILQTAGKKVIAAGNIGYPLSAVANESHNFDYIVAEVSSFQLERCEKFTPLAATCLNVTPDHLDRHGTMENYFIAKMSIFRNIKDPKNIIVNTDIYDNQIFLSCFDEIIDDITTFSAYNPYATYSLQNKFCCHKTKSRQIEKIINKDLIPLIGNHNIENCLAAFALCHIADLKNDQIANGIKSFQVSSHRLELIAKKNDIIYINDSKATNIDATIKAIKATKEIITKKIILIIGGLDKGVDFSALTPILNDTLKHAFLIGTCKHKLSNLWENKFPLTVCDSFEEAVNGACGIAEVGDAVLLAPGCASMDMFKNYAERGNIFKSLIIRNLENEQK